MTSLPEFEFDEAKSRANFLKHGIDFTAALSMWEDPRLLEIPARVDAEARFLVVAKVGSKMWSAIITYRGQRIRIISVRRSRTEEVALYEREDLR